MRQSARARLAPPIAEAVTGVTDPFVQAVYDIGVPRMAFGRACLIGDAAFAVRPHAAAGTAKACADGWALAEALTAAAGDVPAALADWERRQLALGRSLLARCRDIGDSSQFHGTFRPGERRLIFGLYRPGDLPRGTAQPEARGEPLPVLNIKNIDSERHWYHGRSPIG